MMRASSSSASAALSGVLAAVIANPIGTPPPSVRTWRLVPDFARSVGFGPVFFPAQWGFVQGGIGRFPGPLQALGGIIVLNDEVPLRRPHAAFAQGLEAPLHRGAGADLGRDRLPWPARRRTEGSAAAIR